MKPHLIRLRAGWTLLNPHQDALLTLPIIWQCEGPSVLRLERPFHWPKIEMGSEQLFLLIQGVPGLLSVQLNDRVVEIAMVEALVIPIVPSLDRALLTLEVDRLAIPECFLWGRVAIVVASSEANASDIAEVEL